MVFDLNLTLIDPDSNLSVFAKREYIRKFAAGIAKIKSELRYDCG